MCFNYDKYNAKYVNIQTEIKIFLKKKTKKFYQRQKNGRLSRMAQLKISFFLSLLPKKNHHARNWRLQY